MTKSMETRDLETLILCFLTNEWQTTGQIAKLCNKPYNSISKCLTDLVIQKRIEYKMTFSQEFDNVYFKIKENQKDKNQRELF